jgi:hypothetical protein
VNKGLFKFVPAYLSILTTSVPASSSAHIGQDLAEYFGADDDEGYSEILEDGRDLAGLFAKMYTEDQPQASSTKAQSTKTKEPPHKSSEEVDIVVPDADDFSPEESDPDPEGGFDFEAGETDVFKNDPNIDLDASTLRELIMHTMMDCIHRFDGARSYYMVGDIPI